MYVTKEFRHLSDSELLSNGTSPDIELYLNKYHFRILYDKNIFAFEKHISV